MVESKLLKKLEQKDRLIEGQVQTHKALELKIASLIQEKSSLQQNQFEETTNKTRGSLTPQKKYELEIRIE
jgi:hypothetical protein